MDQNTKDFAFFQGHFHPEREPQLMPFKGCPFCGSKLHSIIKDKIICFRCGKAWPNTDDIEKEQK
jgi:hypothetical protein